MGRFIKGDVVVVPFPFSNLTMSKRRPALVVTDLTGDGRRQGEWVQLVRRMGKGGFMPCRSPFAEEIDVQELELRI